MISTFHVYLSPSRINCLLHDQWRKLWCIVGRSKIFSLIQGKCDFLLFFPNHCEGDGICGVSWEMFPQKFERKKHGEALSSLMFTS